MDPTLQPTLQVNSGPSQFGSGSVSIRCLGPDLLALLMTAAQRDSLLKSIFRISVVQALSPEQGQIPDVSGRYRLFEDEVHFVPHFPFERDLKYRATFDLRLLDPFQAEEPLTLEFMIPSEHTDFAPSEVTGIFPSDGLLPENLLRFYVCFSNPMQRGRALNEILLLDSEGRPVEDALYRAPVELWDRTMRRLTVLLDPGRLKRWVGPNLELGPPLKAGEKYTLEIGAGLRDMRGCLLREPFQKHFVVGDPIREPIAVETWKVQPPATGRRHPLVFMFSRSLDWALLFHAITVRSPNGSLIDGQVVVDKCERRWSFTPTKPWGAGSYQVRVAPGLEDPCGNSVTGAFDSPLETDPRLVTKMKGLSFAIHRLRDRHALTFYT
jgi:hypothetical protein